MDSGILKFERGNSNIFENSEKRVPISPMDTKQISEVVAPPSIFIIDQDGVNKRPNPSPFKNEAKAKQEKVTTQLKKSRNERRNENPSEHSQTMPQYPDSYNIIRMQKLKSQQVTRNSSNPRSIGQSPMLTQKVNGKIESGIRQSKLDTKHIKQKGSEANGPMIVQMPEQEYLQLQRFDSGGEQKIFGDLLHNSQRGKAHTNQLFKMPMKKTPSKPQYKQKKLTAASSNSDLRMAQQVSINSSVQHGKLQASNEHRLTMRISPKQFLSPPLKSKQKEIVKKTTLQQKKDELNSHLQQQTEHISRFSDLVDFQQTDTPPKYHYNTVQTQESDNNLVTSLHKRSQKSNSDVNLDDNFLKCRSEEKIWINDVKDNSNNGSQDLVLDDSMMVPKLLLNFENVDSQIGVKQSMQVDDYVSEQHSEQPIVQKTMNCKQKPTMRIENKINRQTIDPTPGSHQTLFSPQSHANKGIIPKNKKSSVNVGNGTTKRANYPQTANFNVETFKQAAESTKKQHQYHSKGGTQELLNPLKTPKTKKSSVYSQATSNSGQSHAQIKKLQEKLERAQTKASKRKREIIELKEENLKLRSLVNFILQSKLSTDL